MNVKFITTVRLIIFISNNTKVNLSQTGPSSKSHCNRQLHGSLVIWLVSQS